jgi:hypothetical protein
MKSGCDAPRSTALTRAPLPAVTEDESQSLECRQITGLTIPMVSEISRSRTGHIAGVKPVSLAQESDKTLLLHKKKNLQRSCRPSCRNVIIITYSLLQRHEAAFVPCVRSSYPTRCGPGFASASLTGDNSRERATPQPSRLKQDPLFGKSSPHKIGRRKMEQNEPE